MGLSDDGRKPFSDRVLDNQESSSVSSGISASIHVAVDLTVENTVSAFVVVSEPDNLATGRFLREPSSRFQAKAISGHEAEPTSPSCRRRS
jgi:hypothetical protein